MSNPIAIVAFAGPAGSGKDTAGKYLIDSCGFKHLSFAMPLKAMLAAVGYPAPATAEEKEAIIPELGVSWRHMAQTLGTEWGRALIDNDIWVKLAEKMVRTEGGKFVITDLRFENEAEMVRRMGGVIGVIEGRAAKMAKDTAKHASETGIAFNVNDVPIVNDGTLEQLYEQVSDLARYVGVERAVA